jgi:hypothetical protein
MAGLTKQLAMKDLKASKLECLASMILELRNSEMSAGRNPVSVWFLM